MERKISALLELRAEDEDSIKNRNLSAGDPFTFSPCNVISCFYEYPIKIILPSSVADVSCQWCYPITFGGGLVEGDNVNISIHLGENCCLLMTTLSFPKVYCCENGFDSQHHTTYFASENSLLCVLPDPLVCFAKASYVQTETFYLESSSNLVLLDWYTSGRHARGEQWDFSKLKSISSIYINGKLKFKEALNLQNVPSLSIKRAMKSYNIFGTCFVIGSYLSSLSRNLLSDLGKCSSYGEKRESSTIFAISPLYIDGSALIGCLVRFASESVENAMKRIEEMLEPLYSVLGGNPFENK